MRGKHGNHAKSAASPRWSEGKMIASTGYAKVRVGRGHPLADPNGYAYEHLIVWCAAGNLPPARGEILHHRNGIKTDNRIENLEKLSMRDHAAAHGRLKLSEEAARNIRERYAAGGTTQVALAAEFGVPHTRISKVIRGQIWRSAGGPISAEDHRTRDPITGAFVGKRAAGRLLDGVEHSEMPA